MRHIGNDTLLSSKFDQKIQRNFYKHHVLLRTMVNIISTISKGTKMDQIYLPKVRSPGFSIGDHVEIIPTKKEKVSFYTHHVAQLEPLKSIIKDEILSYFEHAENVFITGSFLENGFEFNDIDVLVLGEPGHEKSWSDHFKWKLGLPIHIICLNRSSLVQGLQQDPLFQMMMSKYISRKRELFKYKSAFNYKLLDLHLLKSKILINNFDILAGKEKYNLVRNMLAISLFLKKKKLNKEIVDQEMEKIFGKGMPERLKWNTADKDTFLLKFRKAYNGIFEMIMEGIKRGSQSK